MKLEPVPKLQGGLEERVSNRNKYLHPSLYKATSVFRKSESSTQNFFSVAHPMQAVDYEQTDRAKQSKTRQ